MRIRAVAAAGAAIAAVLLTAPPSVPPARAEPLKLTVDPPRGVVPATVALDGACPGEGEGQGDADGVAYPTSAVVSILERPETQESVTLDADGTFPEGLLFAVPADLPAGTSTLELRCPGPLEEDLVFTHDFEVLEAPTLELDPDTGRGGSTVTVAGTCPRRAVVERPTGPEVLFDGVPLGTATPNQETGEFGPTPMRIPTDAASGAHTISTSCGDSEKFTVEAVVPPTTPPTSPPATPPTSPPTTPPTAPTSPPVQLVEVPDLTGRTETEARGDLRAVRLVLTDASGTGRVVDQDPAAGALVPPGTPVSVTLASAPGSTSESRPILPASTVLLGLVAIGATTTALSAERARRRHARERRWVDQQVTTSAGRPAPRPHPVPDAPVPALDVRLEVRSGTPRLYVQEAADAHD